jgi:amino acid permease
MHLSMPLCTVQVNQICRVALVFNVLAGVAYSVFMPRVALLALVQLHAPDLVVKNARNKAKRTALHALLTTTVLATGVLIGVFVDNLGAIYSFVGGVSAIAISLVLPAMCFLKLEPTASKAKRLFCYAVMLFGLFGSVGCIASLIASLSGA